MHEPFAELALLLLIGYIVGGAVVASRIINTFIGSAEHLAQLMREALIYQEEAP